MGWTHYVCIDCWNALRPERAVPVERRSEYTLGLTGPCCRCGVKHCSGIFYRADAADMKCTSETCMGEP